jgi:hypothetical protein
MSSTQMITPRTSRISRRRCWQLILFSFAILRRPLTRPATGPQIIPEGVLGSLGRHDVEGKRQGHTRRNPVRIPIHAHGEHLEGQKARLSSRDGPYFPLFLAALSPIHSFIPARKSADESRAMYASFLQLMGAQYSPEKIKGKRLAGSPTC